MSILSATALAVLKNAGWYEGRRVDAQKNLFLLDKAGYTVFDHVREFLTEFGDLDIKFKNSLDIDIFISFDIEWSLSEARLYERDLLVEDYPRAVGCKMLTLIGRKNTATCLAINENGTIYSLQDGYILEAGKGKAAIDNLITKSYKELKQIPTPDWWGE